MNTYYLIINLGGINHLVRYHADKDMSAEIEINIMNYDSQTDDTYEEIIDMVLEDMNLSFERLDSKTVDLV